MTTEPITWHPAANPPDDDQTVLIHSPRLSDAVWLGYISAGQWLTVEGSIVRDVTHWADLPAGPGAAKHSPADRLVRDLLDPEMFGHAVTEEVRDRARAVIGLAHA